MKLLFFALFTISLPIAYAQGEKMQKEFVQRSIDAFNEVNRDNFAPLKDFYHPDVIFKDPLVTINGLDELTEYYKDMYKSVKNISFHFHNTLINEFEVVLIWKMTFQAARLNSGNPIEVEGTSFLIFDKETEKVIYHRDYFDVAAMVYDYIPGVAFLLRRVRNRLHSK